MTESLPYTKLWLRERERRNLLDNSILIYNLHQTWDIS